MQASSYWHFWFCSWSSVLCVISHMNRNILLYMPVSPLLVVFITATHRDLSWGQGYIRSLSTTFRIVLEILDMSINLYADDTTLSLIGERLDGVFASLNMIVDNVLQWSKNNQLTIHPFAIKTEAMLMRKSSFIAPLPPLSFWSGTIRVVQSTTCLGFLKKLKSLIVDFHGLNMFPKSESLLHKNVSNEWSISLWRLCKRLLLR